MTEAKQQAMTGPMALPIVQYGRQRYFADLLLGQFRDINDPHRFVDFDSEQGRLMCRQAGVAWCSECGMGVIVSKAFDQNAILAMIVGMVATAMVQSSSITTSLLVPLAGAGVLTLRQAFPVTLGANVGTTVTALLAALAATGANATAGITIALVHLLFNISGTVLVYPVQRIRNIPLAGARWIAGKAVDSRRAAVIYVLAFFYGLPAVFAFLNRLFQ